MEEAVSRYEGGGRELGKDMVGRRSLRRRCEGVEEEQVCRW